LGGVQSFKGRSGAVVPAQGEYTDAQVILASTMHIGGETQTNVQQALVALEENGGGLLPYLYIDSEAGSTVTVVAPDSTVITPTQTGSGHWECEVPDYGIYVIHSVLAGQGDATLSLTVDDVKEYHVTDSHYDFTINVTADVGASIRVEAGAETYTKTGTGSPVAFVVHQASTQYTVTETLDGYTDVKTVTSASVTGESVNVTLHVFAATLSISTNSSELFGQAIVISNSGTIVGSTNFTDAGQASYVVHETGTFTLTCTYQGQPYSEDVPVSAETTYPVQIDTTHTYILTVDIYSAAGDTITFTDDNGTETATADSTGKAEGVSITITQPSVGVDPTITFTSSIAKDPSNLSNDYTKTVTITDGTSEVYFMPESPDCMLYWYGNFLGREWSYTGFVNAGVNVTGTSENLQNEFKCTAPASNGAFYGTASPVINAVGATKVHIIGLSNFSTKNHNLVFDDDKTMTATLTEYRAVLNNLTSTTQHLVADISGTSPALSSAMYVYLRNWNTASGAQTTRTNALWFERGD
jgi:hypothetical protein